jgi:ankyrin repeat protein
MEQILQRLDNKDLAKSREITRLWQKCIDTRMYSWLRTVQIPTVLNEGNTYLHLAAKYGQIDLFKVILDIEADKDLVNNNGLTPFHVACQYGWVKIAEMLIKKCDTLKIDLSRKSRCSNTAFHFACIGGKYELAELIMKNSGNLKIDINEKNVYNKTAFDKACENGHSEIVEMLMKNLNLESSMMGYHLACTYGYTNIVKIFIDKAELLKLDLSPGFHKACCAGYTDIAQILIEKSEYLKVDLWLTFGSLEDYYWGTTVFHFACHNGHARIVEMLIDKSEFLKLDLTAISNFWGSTGFQLAVQMNKFDVIDVIKSKMPSLIV